MVGNIQNMSSKYQQSRKMTVSSRSKPVTKNISTLVRNEAKHSIGSTLVPHPTIPKTFIVKYNS